MTHEIIIAGFGGQGVLSMGQLIAYAGMHEGKEVSWLPSYGPEMRGGTANCNVIVSDTPVGAPIADNPTCLMALNLPSLIKYENDVVKGGMIFVNSSLINKKVERTDVEVYYIPCNEIAHDIGNARVANIVMLGAYLEKSKSVSPENILNSLSEVLGPKKQHLLQVNKIALEKGAELVK